MKIHDEYIPDDLYAEFLRRLPQVCVELIVQHEGAVLLCRRTNEPAKGEWFWPGSRIYKGEALDAAAERVARDELGVTVDLDGIIGVYSHFWETSPFAGVERQHTVNVVFTAYLQDDPAHITLDEQHDRIRFIEDLEADLHRYVRQYIGETDILRSA